MIDSTSVLFGLEDEFAVTSLERLSGGGSSDDLAARPGSALPRRGGVLAENRVKDRPLVRIKDLDACGQVIELWWRKRRLTCPEPLCATGSFTQQSEAIPARARLTCRLREAIATEIASGEPGGRRGHPVPSGVVADGAPGVGRRRGQVATGPGAGAGARDRSRPRAR